MKKINKFEGLIIKEAQMGKLAGGSGNVTGNCKGTTETSGFCGLGGLDADSKSTGDWIATC